MGSIVIACLVVGHSGDLDDDDDDQLHHESTDNLEALLEVIFVRRRICQTS